MVTFFLILNCLSNASDKSDQESSIFYFFSLGNIAALVCSSSSGDSVFHYEVVCSLLGILPVVVGPVPKKVQMETE